MFDLAGNRLTRQAPRLSSHHLMRTSQKSLRLCLHQRETGSTQSCLRPLKGFNFSSASLLSNIVVLQEPIALGMHGLDVCHGCHQFFTLCSLLRLVPLQLSLSVCFAGALC